MMFRITSGKFKGKKLTLPPDNLTRPTSTRAREALFSVLFSMGIRLEESVLLDGFAGSGAIGIEALSRGLKKVHFVENNSHVQKILMNNLKSLTGVQNFAVHKDFNTIKENLDIIFLDPPYFLEIEGLPAYQAALSQLSNNINAETLIVVETDATEILDLKKFQLIQTKVYGTVKFWFLNQ